ncbi:MAG: 2-amino-4-hydroxy-6-hydroxymethyldihydropteridine diphosphokinase [Gammaproteobacteria bacterium]|nr:2-amino-4-hydroxy-6-hydroxymethyldihydropteridine diphosphokinase [Gammaproteobacteria bacterium]
MGRTETSVVFIGLGSNLDDPRRQIRMAMQALECIPGSRIVADSGLYLSKPLVPASGAIAQADYLNAVVKIETQLGPHELLDHLQQIEQAQGRERKQRWGPRTIDLDILLFDDRYIKDERLTLPHPGISQRSFVLYPLHNVAATLDIPGHGMLEELITNCPRDGLRYLGKKGMKNELGK